jgi:UDP-N-acetylmuramate--alanine ligase
LKAVDLTGKPFHFLGIGGIGMSALAYILVKRNFPVSGSDLRSSNITERLEALGAKIFLQQEASNLDCFGSEILPQIICSTAINVNNPEYQAAIGKNCPIFHRSDLLAALIANYRSVAVAGTHGKTTTSSLISYILYDAGLDPTIIVGGEVDAWEGNARLGESDLLVAEADESDGSLVKHSPTIGVITNIELDHPDHYQSLDQVIEIFQTFASQCGVLIGCLDCNVVRERLKPEISYSLDPSQGADYTLQNIRSDGDGSKAEVWERNQLLGEINLKLLGKHNLSNALAAIAVSRNLGLEFPVIAEAIAKFTGAKRRFEHKGEYNGITLIDDYAHHPSELIVTLAAAKLQIQQGKYQRLIAIFQPHRYSRTQSFLAEFGESFKDADLVIITDIYSAGEAKIEGLTGEKVAQAIAQHHSQVIYHPDLDSLTTKLNNLLKPGDLVMFLGAGNLNQTIPQLLAGHFPETT